MTIMQIDTLKIRCAVGWKVYFHRVDHLHPAMHVLHVCLSWSLIFHFQSGKNAMSMHVSSYRATLIKLLLFKSPLDFMFDFVCSNTNDNRAGDSMFVQASVAYPGRGEGRGGTGGTCTPHLSLLVHLRD